MVDRARLGGQNSVVSGYFQEILSIQIWEICWIYDSHEKFCANAEKAWNYAEGFGSDVDLIIRQEF